MQKIFNEQFKNLQNTQTGKEKGKERSSVNDQSQSQNNIKSPSDTTIYPPVLRKKTDPKA